MNARSDQVFLCLTEQRFIHEAFKERRHWMRKICNRAGVKPFGWHAIRHFTATALYRAGCPVAVIQAVLRHKSAATTERYLKKLGLTELKESIEAGLSRGNKQGEVIEITKRRTASGGAT